MTPRARGFEGASVGAMEGAQDGAMLRLGINDGNESEGDDTFGPEGGRGLIVRLDDGWNEGWALLLGRSDGMDDGLDDTEGEADSEGDADLEGEADSDGNADSDGEDDSEGDADLDGEADKLGLVLVEGTELGSAVLEQDPIDLTSNSHTQLAHALQTFSTVTPQHVLQVDDRSRHCLSS